MVSLLPEVGVLVSLVLSEVEMLVRLVIPEVGVLVKLALLEVEMGHSTKVVYYISYKLCSCLPSLHHSG